MLGATAALPVRDAAAAERVLVTVGFQYNGGFLGGTPQPWVVPPGVTRVKVIAEGAGGGSAGNPESYGATGGRGARVTAHIDVTPGETLWVHVGGTPTPGPLAGWNGGGSSAGGGGGGGASDVRRGGQALTDRVVVAGGGGGVGRAAGVEGEVSFSIGAGGRGGRSGHAGRLGTVKAEPDDPGVRGAGGQPGTQSAGGTPGRGVGPAHAEPGSLGVGGSSYRGGGGGGGGYYGGGAGSGGTSYPASISGCGPFGCIDFNVTAFHASGGGGGGSSLVPEGGKLLDGRNDGHGSVEIRYRVAA